MTFSSDFPNGKPNKAQNVSPFEMLDMSRVVRKPDFCICENKGADQLRGNRETDQRLCFRYTDCTDSTIVLLPKSEISILKPSSVAVPPGLCRIRSETPNTGFLTTRLMLWTSLSDNQAFPESKPI